MELSVSAGLFFLLVGVMYPNILLFQKSHIFLSKYMEYRFQEREVHRLIQQLLFHLYSDEELEESCFIVEKWDSKWSQKDLKELKKVEQGELIFFSCIFWRQEKKLVKNNFFIYFHRNSLYLGEYRNGIFFEGNQILLLKNINGSFRRKGRFIKMSYAKVGEKEKREVIYERKKSE